MAIQLPLRRPGGAGRTLLDVRLPPAARLTAGAIRQRQLYGLVDGFFGVRVGAIVGAFRWPEREHHVRSATPEVSARRRHCLTGGAGRSPAGRRWRSSFMNNVPDPTLAGKDLPTFKFALEKSDGKVVGNSYGKEATVTQLPISKGIAGGLDAA